MWQSAKQSVLKWAFSRYYSWRLDEMTGRQIIALEYPVTPAPRFIPGRNVHPELWDWFNAQRSACTEGLQAVSDCLKALERIPMTDSGDPKVPHWGNAFFSALDGMALYSLVTSRRPPHIVEVGSGNSTKFARQAIRDAGLTTTLISVDPTPRAEIDSLCSEVYRKRLEDVDQQIFRQLVAGDFLFIDSSHRSFTNSDVTTFFLEILPRLARGVVVHIHDIFLPWDYPVEWNSRFYSEQYLMATWLLAGPQRCRLLLSNAFTSYDPSLRSSLTRILAGSPLASLCSEDASYGGIRGLAGVSLWFEVS